jgi:sugar-specific transcriptional regulator TrmB
LGLDAEEAAVYVHLSMLGPSKASDIAAALKMHRTETYRTLQTLVQRGFASSTLSRPAKFEAAPPEKLFQELLAAQQARQDNIARAQGEIASALSTLRSQPAEATSKNTFKVLQGRREIYGVLERMIREAKQDVAFLSTHEAAFAMGEAAGLVDVLVDRARAGVRVRGLLRTTKPARERIAALPDIPGLTWRNLNEPTMMRFVVSDHKELLLWVVSDPSSRLTTEADVAIWSDASDFVATQSALFDLAWVQGQDVRVLLAADGVVADQPTRR